MQELKQATEREAQRALERAMARDLELKDARISERDALTRAGRAEGELGAARDELARTRAVAAERDQLSQKLIDVDDQTEAERRGSAERAQGVEAGLAAARQAERTALARAERTALARAERAEGEAAVLREQLAQLTATLRGKSPGTTAAGRRGAN